ncbi:MAG: anhydro-N-acetylmuramic acid kinase [Anaerolineaceae bacterium]
MLVIGLMSGTSADGVDAALLDLQGAPPAIHWKLLGHVHHAYSPELQAAVLACARAETGTLPALCQANFWLAEAFARAVVQVIEQCGLTPERVDLIGSHGQTVWHIPDGPHASTLQIGEAAVIAERTGITTIHNFRPRDMAAGGQGAPLTSYTDALLFTHPAIVRACQNIGGIANLTFLPPSSQTQYLPLAFDTGPGNMLLDDAIRRLSGGAETFDRDGRRALRGRVHPELLDGWLQTEPYYTLQPPKTTGRELFTHAYGSKLWDQAREMGLNADDFIATLTALTARTIADGYRSFLPLMPEEIIVSGGGALNPVLMSLLRQELAPARLLTSDEMGLPSEAKEAAAFALLAYETWHNRPSTLPSATGARHPSVLGSITPGKNWRHLDH